MGDRALCPSLIDSLVLCRFAVGAIPLSRADRLVHQSLSVVKCNCLASPSWIFVLSLEEIDKRAF